MRSRVHLEGGFTVDIAETSDEVETALRVRGGVLPWLFANGPHGATPIRTERILWVSTIPEVAP